MRIVMLLTLGGMTLTTPAASADDLPAAIASYYRDHNFVTSFSRLEERQMLARSGPDHRGDERLGHIARLMRRLEAQVEEVDPGIQASGPAYPLTAARADLLQVRSSRVDEEKGEAWVELDVLALEPADVAHYVSRYAELAGHGRTASLRDLARLRPGGPFRVMSSERHLWTRVDGRWLRAAATYHFVTR